MTDTIIRLERVSKSFGALRAVDEVSLEIHAGEIFGVIGYSGAGKSTLVRLINALERHDAGELTVAGEPLSPLSETRLRGVRAGIGMIFQHFNLLGSRTVAANVAYPLEVAGWPRTRRRARVAELLEFVGLSDKARAYPAKLSGGQKQRVGIARALATSPRILLADEPTSALDPETTADVLSLLQRVNAELGITVVVITHEMDVVRAICHRVAVMDSGRVVEAGPTYDVFTRPRAPMTRTFVASTRRDRPSAEVVERLRARHTGRLLTIGVDDETRSSVRLQSVLGRHDVAATLVYGGITEVSGRPSGSLTYELTGPGVAGAVAELRGLTDVEDWGATSSTSGSGASEVRP
ncbi:ATP-binding cassette domain-containing protein [Pseudactinotalea sp. HY160]|uniref:methionine ABC transporter ATP-binding protein n=1 Tax=Pseudactinotalea sp. HY160 TaxID=2654490 RepID=UPI00128B08B2|nr:methionine ABC transporter ATP-binding protein [Pseudactinotalea sp. HY160]MPV51133.1 ATP-binding cassette domain-containing protein [Pseudactinotalea sp. HY160]